MRRMFSKKQVEEISLEKIESTTNLKVFENIVDKDGHKRFIEGNGTNEVISGITFTYSKFSLSGTHLMFVIAGTCNNATELTNSLLFSSFTIPSWIWNKIFGVWQTTNVIRQQIIMYADDWTTQSPSFVLAKGTDNRITVRHVGTTTLTADRSFRMQFDLLIDNE